MIGVGIIGYGYWGPNLVRNFMEVEDTRVISICDLDTERRRLASARHPAILVTEDSGEVIADSSVDAVAIATPVSQHYELAMRALQAGKHVLVEKPITASSDEARRLIDVADTKDLVLAVDHTFIYTGAVRKIRELIESDHLGDLLYYDSSRINLGLFQHDVNVVWDLAVHDIAIMDFLVDAAPHSVVATGMSHVPGQPRNVAFITMFFEDRLIAHFNVNWLAPVKLRRTIIGGTKQMLVYDDLDAVAPVQVYDKGIEVNEDKDAVYEMLISYRWGDMWAPRIDSTEALNVEVRHFAECVKHGKMPVADGAAGLRVVRVLEAATRSMNEGGVPVSLEGSG